MGFNRKQQKKFKYARWLSIYPEKNSPNQIEQKWQNGWAKAKIFEAEPSKTKKKFFITVPYPYISGSLHIGHARVVTEADVFSRFQRMAGKNVLYPMAFHISGTPILGISLAIKSGDKNKIDLYKGYVARYVSNPEEIEKTVASFEDPNKIVEFFIPKMIEEFKLLGLGIDWRRSYTSGDYEHQALVEWQFKKYKKQEYLVQGKYPILFSKTLNNAVGEDDISDGDTEPVEIQQFTGIKFKFEDGFLIAATLRPETMYGQTNMWVNPEIEYVKAEVDGEKWFISKECFEKLSFQDHKVNILSKIHGTYFMGKKCLAPFIEREIIILPSLHCDPDIGTGIVTSVPSDAPYDWIPLKELQENKKICEKYGISFEEVKAIKLIPIIKSKGFGEFPAVEICQKMGITKLSQQEKLDAATQEIYKAGFHTGIMDKNSGPYAGMGVMQAKELMKNKLLEEKQATIFYETSRKAQSRDGGKVIVAILDNQWFLDFNAKEWKTKSKKSLDNLQLWPEKYRKQFDTVFEWLDKRPCARMRGLGTKLPFDNKWVIESLSDSTIYMALYPIINIIRENKINKEQLTNDFFEYVMNSKGTPKEVAKKTGIKEKTLLEINTEWNYWYPFDQRHTFDAHLSNHLSFMIFAHTSAFEQKHWPKRISFHGMVISEGEKMSKSKGNVVTLADISEKYGADSFRAFMCNSTSVESTFNWNSDKVEGMKKTLFAIFETLKEIQTKKTANKKYEKFKSFISKTERAVKKSTQYLEKMNLRDYSNIVIFDMNNNYRKVKQIATPEEIKSINNYLANTWTALLAPIVPHLAEEIWQIGGNKGFVSIAQWPEANEKLINENAERIEELTSTLRTDILRVKELAKIKKISKVKVFVAPEWKWAALKIIVKACDGRPDFGTAMRAVIANPEIKKHGAEIQPLIKTALNRINEFAHLEKFDEVKVLNEAKPQFEKEFGSIEIIRAEESKEPKSKNAFPGKPALLIE